MTLKLPRLASQQQPWGYLQRAWQALCERIETAVADLSGIVDQLVIINGGLAALDAAVIAAQQAADAAQGAADGIIEVDALRQSYVTGLTVTATDAGSDATINLSAHTRVYADGVSVAVNAGSVAGLAYDTPYWVGYDDPNRVGGAVVYTASTMIKGNGSTPGYHLVASQRTPAAAAPDVPGIPALPPGAALP